MLFSSSVKGSTLFVRGLAKKSHEPVCLKVAMVWMLRDLKPSTRNLRARPGRSPVEAELRLVVSDNRMMAWSEPSSKRPV